MHRFLHARVLAGTAASLLCAALLMPGSLVAQEAGSLSATLYQGNCYVRDDESAVPLQPLTLLGDTRALAIPAFSESVVPVPFETLTGTEHALVIERAAVPGYAVACGEIDGLTAPDGTLVVGLREENASFFAGIALLVPNGGETIIRAYVGNGIARGTVGEAVEGDLPIDDTINVAVTDDGITADQTELTVGHRVEFVVTNDGRERHELMLEEEGADEEPLTEHGNQAETEDIAPGEVGAFAYTFAEAGTYWLADHIGSDVLWLEITVR